MPFFFPGKLHTLKVYFFPWVLFLSDNLSQKHEKWSVQYLTLNVLVFICQASKRVRFHEQMVSFCRFTTRYHSVQHKSILGEHCKRTRYMVIMVRDLKEYTALIESPRISQSRNHSFFFPVYFIFSFYLTPKRSIDRYFYG